MLDEAASGFMTADVPVVDLTSECVEMSDGTGEMSVTIDEDERRRMRWWLRGSISSGAESDCHGHTTCAARHVESDAAQGLDKFWSKIGIENLAGRSNR